MFTNRPIAHRLFLVLVTLAIAVPAAAQTNATSPKTLANIGESLGTQIRKTTIMRSDPGKDAQGKPVIYTVLMGDPATLAIIDVNSEKVTRTLPLPGTSGAWGVKVSSDNTVYLGCYNQGLIYRYFPETGELKNLGFPFPTKDAVVYPMDTDTSGVIYGGTYPSGHLYKYDPAQAAFTDLGAVTDNPNPEIWLRDTVYDATTHKLYVGVGNQPELIEYDIASGEKRNILPPKYSNITSPYELDVAGGRLFCRKETHDANTYFVLDTATGEEVEITNAETGETGYTFQNSSRGLSPLSPVDNKMYYAASGGALWEYDLDTNTVRPLNKNLGGVPTGYGYAKLDDPAFPGYTLIGTVGMAGRLLKYNLQTGKLTLSDVQLPAQPINIHDVELGPDGKIYTGGYLGGNVGVYDPATGESRYFNGMSQTEGMASVDGKIYLGIYPSARMYEFDPALPWDMTGANGQANPVHLYDLKDNEKIPGYTLQDRTFAMAGADDLNKLFIGTVPKNNQLGGVLAVYDVKTKAEPEVYWNLVPDQSIVSLVYKDGMVYGGSSVYGGMGSDEKATQAVLFVWDPAAKKIVHELTPVPGCKAITALHAGPDGNIWGLADGTLFIYDPQQEKVVYTKDEFPDVHDWWIGGSLVTGDDGNVYGTVGGRFFKIDAETKELTELARGAKRVARDRAGNFYLYGGSRPTELYKVNPENL